jgi:ABC-type multidrug transport system fused ATPase/permease subunit
LFNFSIKDNILYGKSDASNQEIIDAAKHAQAYDFISKFESEVKGSDEKGDDDFEVDEEIEKLLDDRSQG